MSKFDSLSGEKEFLVVHAKRSAVLVELHNLKKSLESLPKENPSLRSFERIESRVDNIVDRLQTASEAVTAYFCKVGGDPLNDSGYDGYCDSATNVIGEVEILRDSYHDLLKNKGLLQPTKPPVLQADLVEALKSLADSTGEQAKATQAQANAALHHHKVPEMASPIFNPAESKNNPLAWANFWQRFALFAVDCVDDKSRMGFLQDAVKGDAFGLIKNLKCTDQNFKVAKDLLEKYYNKPNSIREKILLQCLKFKVPKASSDLSGFVLSMINLSVYINELKLNHNIDILAEDSGCHLIRAVLQDILPGDILDKYQNLLGSEYPTLEQFISKAQDVADRIARKQKNHSKDKNNSGSLNSTPQNASASNSTIPSTISAVNTQIPKPKPVNKCMICTE